MDAAGEQIGENLIDQPLPPHAVHPGEQCALHLYREMALARAVMASVAAVVLALVAHDEPCGGERRAETALDLGGDGAGSGDAHGAYIPAFWEGGEDLADGGDGRRAGPRFHGRVESGRPCEHPGCDQPGEFRAPAGRTGRRDDGPGGWRWLCLDHVRAFNAGYNFFSGMDPDEIAQAQRPYAGWERETRAFSHVGADRAPRWADFADPLDAIGARFRQRVEEAQAAQRPRTDGKPLSGEDRASLKVLGLGPDADRRELRTRYAELVRRYHPDRNGGDRSHERALQQVIDAYTRLKRAPAFA